MQTAMQELKERILIRYPYHGEDMTQEMKDMQSWLIDEIDLAGLPKEREQIEESHMSGQSNAGLDPSVSEALVYFNQTFNNQTQIK